jgi:hypothetical protein
LLDKLSKEHHSGFVDIILNDKKGWGIILFQEGEIIEAVMADEKSTVVSGKNSLNKIIDDVQKIGATFNVYRAALEGGADRAVRAQTQDLQGAIHVMQEVVRIIESVVDSLAKRPGVFLDNLKKAQIEKSEDYPFLDPFAAEFEYRDGEIKFQGEVPVERFVRGIKDCIDLALDKIPLDITKNELYTRLKSALQPTIEKFKREIDNIGLKSTMPEFIIF